ncbi:hypothetical protein FOTG_18522 [Fusarium oxysporum f. sp. vasinfectum 25433]|uniref:VWFA domain-containing protein n=1 Tax=Fusarium oxysporum f. sp. vasinfectum 25433 TaxID=1089449 RepID=X0KWE2_FUSOX|nr:hypothetical protein FOTG_18522 [Fusarium oxysporum f. sp. vasinfectum 25433]
MFSRIKDKFSNKKSTEDHTHFDRGNSNSNPKNNPFLDVPEEAPPAYEPTQRTAPLLNVPQRGASPAPSISSITSAEDRYAFLSTFDTIFVIDDSGSMAGRSWREVREALSTIAPICTSHDPDGIDVYFLNHRSPAVGTGVQAPGGYFQIRDANQVQHLFESLFQVGNELGAAKALRELDDDLADQGIRDMVDTATWNSTTSDNSKALTADGILKVVLGAVVRRLDRKSTRGSPQGRRH